MLFTFGMWVLRRIFGLKEEVFVALVLGNGGLLFGIGCEVGTALTGVGGIADFIFGSVIHERIKERMSYFFSDINFYPLSLL